MVFSRAMRLAAAVAVCAMLALPALGQPFPSRPIKILVAFGPGGTADSVARLYGQKLGEILNTPVVIDNKPGGNQMTAIRILQASAPDGCEMPVKIISSSVPPAPGVRLIAMLLGSNLLVLKSFAN